VAGCRFHVGDVFPRNFLPNLLELPNEPETIERSKACVFFSLPFSFRFQVFPAPFSPASPPPSHFFFIQGSEVFTKLAYPNDSTTLSPQHIPPASRRRPRPSQCLIPSIARVSSSRSNVSLLNAQICALPSRFAPFFPLSGYIVCKRISFFFSQDFQAIDLLCLILPLLLFFFLDLICLALSPFEPLPSLSPRAFTFFPSVSNSHMLLCVNCSVGGTI